MPLPTDRGYVVITDDVAGTRTVQICAGVQDGVPRDVFAMHVRSSSVVVHPEVALATGDGTSWTRDVAQVYADGDGTVHVTSAGRAALS